MPILEFQHVKTGKVESVYFKPDQPREYNGPNGKQKGKWKRVWSAPNAAVDTRVDPHSQADFVRATAKGKGQMGDLWDRAAELSHERASRNGGVDPVKEKFYERYSKKHKGTRHPEQVREEATRRLKADGIEFDMSGY